MVLTLGRKRQRQQELRDEHDCGPVADLSFLRLLWVLDMMRAWLE